MIQNTFGVVAALIAIEAGILWMSSQEKFKSYFSFLPAVFWIYVIPMFLSAGKILPSEHWMYEWISAYMLPMALFLLLVSSDIPAIFKLGRIALITMLSGSIGIILAAPLVVWMFKYQLPPEAWMGFGVLSGSWIGGSANMIAVKEAMQVPDNIFLPMITVDVIVAYSWMAVLIALQKNQKNFDQWNKSKRSVIDELTQKTSRMQRTPVEKLSRNKLTLMIWVAIAITFLSIWLARLIGFKWLSLTAWTILIVTALGIAASFSPLQKMEPKGATKIGYWFLYFVLASIGAKANFTSLSSLHIFILAGFLWVFIHFLFMILVARMTKAPFAIVAAASQANIGGPVSAPLLAAVYEPALAPVGLLLGIFGNIIGTYAGIFCFNLLRLLS